MIAIYDQVRKTVSKINQVQKSGSAVYAGRIGDDLFSRVGDYIGVEQAQWVLDQIAAAIEQGKALYRMPSVEEVETDLKIAKKSCDDCFHKINPDQEYQVCGKCRGNDSWTLDGEY